MISRQINGNDQPLIYYPQPVYVPDDAGVERCLRLDLTNPQFRTGENGDRLTDRDLSQYDRKTLFYDLFFSADRRYLFCIGPPFLDFGDPLAIECHGQRLAFEVDSPVSSASIRRGLRKYVCVRVDMRGVEMRQASLDLKFKFVRFEVPIQCSRQTLMLLEETPVTLATLQKDNDPRWIEDWCIWHHRAHGIGRIIIYDNGSANFEAVSARLASLPGIECIFVHWPYPCGPIRSRYNAYCQLGSLEHTRLFFGLHTRWCVNLDIDEYLYNTRSLSLARYLRKPLVRMMPALYLSSYRVADTATVDDKAVRRCFDFHLRQSSLAFGSKKFIYQPAKIAHIESAHRVRAPFFLHKLFKLRYKLYDRVVMWMRNFKWCGLPGFSREPALFFYHFHGLNTKWKTKFFNQQAQEHRRAFFLDVVPDDRIPAMKDKLDRINSPS